MNSRRDQDDQVERVNIINDKIDEKRAATIIQRTVRHWLKAF